MKIAFYKAFQPKATALDKTVAVCSFGKYSHVELVFSDGTCFSVSPRDGGARFKKIHLSEQTWKIIDLPITDHAEKEIRDIAKNYIGYKYDYIGAIFSVMPICIQKNNRLFCSEIATNLLNHCIYYNKLGDGCKYSPNDLYKKLKELNV